MHDATNYWSLSYTILDLGLFFGWWWVKYRIVSRAGFNGWLSIFWMAPILGWFFKLWFAFSPWPSKRAPKASTTSGRKRRKRATA